MLETGCFHESGKRFDASGLSQCDMEALNKLVSSGIVEPSTAPGTLPNTSFQFTERAESLFQASVQSAIGFWALKGHMARLGLRP